MQRQLAAPLGVLRSPLPPLGVVRRAANQDGMIANGNHTSVSCHEAAKEVPLVFFDLLLFNEPHPLCDSLRAA